MTTPWTPAPTYPSRSYPARSPWGWIVPLIVIVAVVVLVVAAWVWYSPPLGPPYDHARWWFFFPFGLLFLLFVLFFIVRVAFWSVRTGGPGGHGRRYGPRAILQARYARGEITREQYYQMLRDLDGPN